MNDLIEELKDELNLNIIEYDYDLDEEVKKYDVGRKLPVLILLDENDKEIKRIIGERSKKDLVKEIKGDLWKNI